VRITILTMAGICAAGVAAGSFYALRSRKALGAEVEPDPALAVETPEWDLTETAGLEKGAGAA